MRRILAESKRIVTGCGRARKGVAALAAAVFLAGTACRRGDNPVSRGAPVVLISIDTLRADHLPAYGYRGVDTPNIDALRQDAVLFENAYAHVPLTLPSHASIFTGLLPPQTGVRDNIGYALGPEAPTIASSLKARGYATGGAVSSIVLSHATGISRGFDFYEDGVEPTKVKQSIGRVQRVGGETAAHLKAWIGEVSDRPFFAFLHLFEPHTPYEPPEPHRSRYPLPYDGEIARADEVVGDFLRSLKDQGVYEKALVILLSDHGEGLNDHGEDEHGVLLYREAIHVPLLVKFPGGRRAGETVKTPVALIDVFPTVAQVVGAPIAASLAGRPLTAPAITETTTSAARRIYSETLFPRIHLGWSDLASLVDDRHHYIESPQPELYDIVADPAEKKDLSAGLPPAFRALRAELARIPHPIQAPGGSDPEQIKKLAALGYISVSSTDFGKERLPAPRDRIGAVVKLKAGFGAFQARRFSEAATLFRELLKSEPAMTDVWLLLGEASLKLGRDQEALEALQEAARLAPGNPAVLLALADFYLETGDFAQARKHAEAVGDTGSISPHENLARIAIAEGNLEAAERASRAALEKYPQRRIPRMILARVRRERHDYSGALEQLEIARRPRGNETSSPLPSLSFLRGDCLARLGREAEAEAAFRDEMRDFPGNTAARAALALLYASQGREDQARQTLSDLVAQVHTPDAYFAAIRTYEVLGDPQTASELKAEARRRFPTARERKSALGG